MKEDRHEKNTYWGPRYMTLKNWKDYFSEKPGPRIMNQT